MLSNPQALGLPMNVDDGVMLGNRSSSGELIADPAKFTNGSLEALGDYLHERKLKLGVYSSGGTKTCMGRAGTFGHEAQDAATWARWGVDYAKLDWCNSKEPARTWYPKMQKALNGTGRQIFFAMCEWGNEQVWTWGHAVANSWRTGNDICSYWNTDDTVNPYCHGVADIIQNNEQYARYSGPFGFNDPCFLVTGSKYMHGTTNLSLTEDQSIAQFSLWAMMASPLIMSIDLQKLTPFQLSVLGNKEVIDIDQDSLGQAGRIVLGHRQPAGDHPRPPTPAPSPSDPCAFPSLRTNCTDKHSSCTWQYCCPSDWSASSYGAVAGKSCGTGVDPALPDPTLDRCCWNREIQVCCRTSFIPQCYNHCIFHTFDAHQNCDFQLLSPAL